MPTTAELVDHVLGEAHERLQARCDRNKIVEILEDGRECTMDVHCATC